MPVRVPQPVSRAAWCPAPLSPESGQGMLEYILIVVFVVIASVAVWRTFGEKVVGLVNDANSTLDTVTVTVPESTGKKDVKQ